MKTQKSFFEQNGGTYMQVGDVLLPDLSIGEVEQRPIGKYGRMWKLYLKEHRPVLYTNLLLSGKLFQHLAEIDGACEERMELLIQQMAKREGVSEALKAADYGYSLYVGQFFFFTVFHRGSILHGRCHY